MKKIFICTMMVIIAATSLSQDVNPNQPLTRDHYQKKSKNQKTVAWLLLGGGTVMAVTGIIVGLNQIGDEPIRSGLFGENLGGSAALFFGGLGVAAGSIPLFVASARNRKKALAVVSANLKIEKKPAIYRGEGLRSYPALSIRITLQQVQK